MRRLLTMLGLLFGVSIAPLAIVNPVLASPQPIHIVGTQGYGVRIQPQPAPVLDNAPRIPEGASPDYLCYTHGTRIGGNTPGSYTDIWFKVNWRGTVGYYTSYYDDVPLSKQTDIEGNYGIGRCEASTSVNQTPSNSYSLNPAPTVFDRQAAANWALQHAQDIRTNRFSDCTWFVSQALWYGGFHQTDGWNSYTNHGFKLWPIPGTVSATAASQLYSYLMDNIPVERVTLEGGDEFKTNAVPQAQVGDLIFYSWYSDVAKDGSNIDHAAIVVGTAPGRYPEVAEWGTAPFREPYIKRGWTWSELHHQWLQQIYPKVSAVLMHFTVPNY